MVHKITVIKSEQLEEQVHLKSSAHQVTRCLITKQNSSKADLKLNDVIFIKNSSSLERQEECTFSCLYRMDIGQSAAKTVFYEKKGRKVGTASIGLSNFIEYWKVHNKRYQQEYDAQNKTSILNEIFELDPTNHKPVKIKMVKGLASVMMSSLLYADDDFHCGNFGLAKNNDGKLIWARLDFGMSFSSITNQKGRPFREVSHHFDKISLADLEGFPELKDAKPFYWPTSLDIYNYTLNSLLKIF